MDESVANMAEAVGSRENWFEEWRAKREQIDSELASAIGVFHDRWGSYTERSRQYPLVRLFRELIEPAWAAFCIRHPALSQERIAQVWKRHQKANFPSEASGQARQKKKQQSLRLSDVAHTYGFDELTRFLEQLIRQLQGAEKWSVEYLRDTVDACALKSSKKIFIKGAMMVNVEAFDSCCRFCGKKTELYSHIDGEIPMPSEASGYEKRKAPRLSTVFCREHRARAQGNKSVNWRYRSAKRSEEKFLREWSHLDDQAFIAEWRYLDNHPHFRYPGTIQPQSGNELTDEFLFRLVSATKLWEIYLAEGYSGRVRAQARELVDKKISDRKKEIVALLARGLNQTAAGKQLGISRQAVSKALKSIPNSYRLDRVSSC